MYLAKRRNETALKRYDGIDIHQRIPVNGKELDKYRGVDGLNHGAKAGKALLTAGGRCGKHQMKNYRTWQEVKNGSGKMTRKQNT